MSADLREAVNAAAEYQFGIDAALLGIDAERLGQAWDDAKPAVKHAYRESVRDAVTGAAPVIEAAVRAQIVGARAEWWTWEEIDARDARGDS